MTNFHSFDNNEKRPIEASPEKVFDNKSPASEPVPPKSSTLPTVGQLMRSTSQAVERVYKAQIDQRPNSVRCTLLAEKVVIWIEGGMTPLEKLLYQEDQKQAQLLCSTIDKLMYPFLVDVIAQSLGVEVVTLISGTSYDNNCTGMIAQLARRPSVRPAAHKSA